MLNAILLQNELTITRIVHVQNRHSSQFFKITDNV